MTESIYFNKMDFLGCQLKKPLAKPLYSRRVELVIGLLLVFLAAITKNGNIVFLPRGYTQTLAKCIFLDGSIKIKFTTSRMLFLSHEIVSLPFALFMSESWSYQRYFLLSEHLQAFLAEHSRLRCDIVSEKEEEERRRGRRVCHGSSDGNGPGNKTSKTKFDDSDSIIVCET